MRRAQLPPSSRHTFVLRRYKLVYVSTPKVACSSLKWVVAGIAGEDPEVFEQAVRRSPGKTMKGIIHQRDLWQHVPTLHELTDAELAEIDGANGWHIFAVVRHPTSRLWSAWQEKILLRVPGVLKQLPEHLVPNLPRTTGDVVEGFHRFVAGMARGECGELMRNNSHFAPQRRVLAAARMPYTRVYTIAELDQAMADLDARVRACGGDPVPPLRSSNETPLKPLRSMFTDDVLTAIGEAYAGDVRRWFRGADPTPSGALDDGEYPASLLAEVGRLADRHALTGRPATPTSG